MQRVRYDDYCGYSGDLLMIVYVMLSQDRCDLLPKTEEMVARGFLHRPQVRFGFLSLCVFFFQAEDGIRDYKVTGVQTCALPIFHGHLPSSRFGLEGCGTAFILLVCPGI